MAEFVHPLFQSTHGRSGTPEHVIWKNIIQRCTNPRNTAFKTYGGRGITISPVFRGPNGFQRFFDEVGPRPKDMTLDRRENDKGYEPGNLRWATRKEQNRNRRDNRAVVRSDGKRYDHLVEAAADVRGSAGAICEVCRGHRAKHHGYGWTYATGGEIGSRSS